MTNFHQGLFRIRGFWWWRKLECQRCYALVHRHTAEEHTRWHENIPQHAGKPEGAVYYSCFVQDYRRPAPRPSRMR